MNLERSRLYGWVVLAEKLQCADQACFEVVDPLVFLRVNHNILVKGDTELAGGELLRIDIGDLDGSFGSFCRDNFDGDNDIDADSCGQDIIQIVVDVLADDVYTTRATCNEIRLLAIGLGELLDEIVPASFYLGGH